jgi:WD40 repeat protein
MKNREPARNRAGVLLAFLAVVIVVASVIGTLAATGRFALSHTPGARPGVLDHVLRIDTVRSADLYCPSAPSFSPDGSQFAVLGTGIACNDPTAVLPSQGRHKLVVYNVQTGDVRHVIQLDQFFQPNISGACTDISVRAVQFTGLGWSPDGDHFGVLFAAFDSSDALFTNDQECSGLLSLSIGSGTAAFINGDAGFFDAPTGIYAGYPVWDLYHLSSMTPQSVAPSLVYGWTQNGIPQSVIPLDGQPLGQLPIRSGPNYPVGDPQSDSTYTLWQPGIVAGPEVFAGGTASPSDDDVFVTQFPSWTPNGQYATMIVDGVTLAPPATQTAIAPTPTSSTAVPQMPLPASMAEVPARDPALVAVQGQVGVNGWAMTAWNDKGTVLASIDCNDAAHARLELRETQAAMLIGSMPLGFSGADTGCSVFNSSVTIGDYPNPNLSLQWAPDGSHLLLSDQLSNTVTLWHVAPSPLAS